MGFRREDYMLVLEIALMILALAMPGYLGVLPSGAARVIASFAVIILVFGYVFHETSRDLKETRYRSKKLILAQDIIEIVAVGIICFMGFRNSNTQDIGVLVSGDRITTYSALALFCAMLLRYFMKSQRFNNEHKPIVK